LVFIVTVFVSLNIYATRPILALPHYNSVFFYKINCIGTFA